MATPECGQRAEAINSAVLAGRWRYARGSWGVSECVCFVCCFAFVKICFLCIWEGGIGEGKAMMCGGVVAVLIGHGEAPDLLAWCG
jgi:hypothetical protein